MPVIKFFMDTVKKGLRMGTESCKDAFLSDGSSGYDCTATKTVSNATPADASKASKGPVRHFRLPTLRSIRSFLLALALIMTLGAATAASASAVGDLTVTKGGDRSASNNSAGATTYADPVQGARFEYTTDNTLPQTGWVDFTNLTDANGQATQAGLADGTYFVREKTPPVTEFNNFGPVQELAFNPNSAAPTALEPYVARVTIEDGQTTYAYPHSNNSGNPNNWTPTNSGSGPIGESTTTARRFSTCATTECRQGSAEPTSCWCSTVRARSAISGPVTEAAAKAFVNNLDGTPVQIGIISFNSSVNSYQPATGDSQLLQRAAGFERWPAAPPL